MARRLFHSSDTRDGKAYVRGETAKHLRKVLRAERGQKFEISTGDALYLAELTDFGRDEVEFTLLEELSVARPAVRIHLLPALIKFDHFEWMLEKATELGVERITPVYSIRVEKGLDQAAAKRRERWLRILVEAGQQSRRVAPPQLDEPVRLSEALATTADQRIWLEEQAGADALLRALATEGESVAILCGPEGGWDDRERESASAAGWRAVSLGSNILRAETAVLASISTVLAAFQAR
jgi:16S rRNA (uracil1498-N3)-methyltransferase